ncbi:SET domain-containing protein [Cryptosporidium felis]|nr:SET domain-containing protein [Cryptosporidium felis]
MWDLPDSVEVRDCGEKGRGLVAKREIPPGEGVFREEAFCKVVFEDFGGQVCDNCFRYLGPSSTGCKGAVGCDECRKIKFCSQECREKSEEEHSFECELLRSGTLKEVSRRVGVTFDRCRLLARREAGAGRAPQAQVRPDLRPQGQQGGVPQGNQGGVRGPGAGGPQDPQNPERGVQTGLGGGRRAGPAPQGPVHHRLQQLRHPGVRRGDSGGLRGSGRARVARGRGSDQRPGTRESAPEPDHRGVGPVRALQPAQPQLRPELRLHRSQSRLPRGGGSGHRDPNQQKNPKGPGTHHKLRRAVRVQERPDEEPPPDQALRVPVREVPLSPGGQRGPLHPGLHLLQLLRAQRRLRRDRGLSSGRLLGDPERLLPPPEPPGDHRRPGVPDFPAHRLPQVPLLQRDLLRLRGHQDRQRVPEHHPGGGVHQPREAGPGDGDSHRLLPPEEVPEAPPEAHPPPPPEPPALQVPQAHHFLERLRRRLGLRQLLRLEDDRGPRPGAEDQLHQHRHVQPPLHQGRCALLPRPLGGVGLVLAEGP